ncbi:MAG: Lysyl endopeptidase [Luteibacter sp.]|uniref:trypsin-like serine peptidase n=1 Tax=Luteibacter sp. TaxID=1886636 RepID=UPI001385219A|nr:serine protease [Luteibacter sp.]KAF1004478.1 MAG: Lysyl endopeptidase [Luteibacter sp.]
MRKKTFLSVCLGLALGLGASVVAAQTAGAKLTEMAGDVAIEQANPASIGQAQLANPRALPSSVRVQVAAPDTRTLASARTASLQREQGVPLQVGLGLKNTSPDIDLAGLNWVDLPDGRHVAQFPVASSGAGGLRAAIRLEANGGRVPDGVVLHFVGSGANVFEATGKDFTPGQSYWTPAVEGDSLTVELVLPRDSHPGDFHLSVPQVSYFGASPYKAGYSDGFGSSGSCENDVVCSTNSGKAAYDNATKAVAKMLFTDSSDGGSYICTGTLLNNSNSPKRQLFWSAAHCIADQTTASSLQTIWFYNTTQCHGSASTINSAVTVLTGGATLLHRDASRDTLLLELKKTPPAGVFYQGWNSTSIANNSSTTDIHHPAGDAKKYSLGTVGAVNANYSSRTHMTKVNWTSSVTEGGSSGSGLLTIATDGSYQLRGGLFGGPSSCSASSANKNDYFSDFGGVYSQIASYFGP